MYSGDTRMGSCGQRSADRRSPGMGCRVIAHCTGGVVSMSGRFQGKAAENRALSDEGGPSFGVKARREPMVGCVPRERGGEAAGGAEWR